MIYFLKGEKLKGVEKVFKTEEHIKPKKNKNRFISSDEDEKNKQN